MVKLSKLINKQGLLLALVLGSRLDDLAMHVLFNARVPYAPALMSRFRFPSSLCSESIRSRHTMFLLPVYCWRLLVPITMFCQLT